MRKERGESSRDRLRISSLTRNWRIIGESVHEGSSRSRMEQLALRVLVEDKQEVSRGTASVRDDGLDHNGA